MEKLSAVWHHRRPLYLADVGGRYTFAVNSGTSALHWIIQGHRDYRGR